LISKTRGSQRWASRARACPNPGRAKREKLEICYGLSPESQFHNLVPTCTCRVTWISKTRGSRRWASSARFSPHPGGVGPGSPSPTPLLYPVRVVFTYGQTRGPPYLDPSHPASPEPHTSLSRRLGGVGLGSPSPTPLLYPAIPQHICVRAARTSGCARCGAGAGCSAITHQSLLSSQNHTPLCQDAWRSCELCVIHACFERYRDGIARSHMRVGHL